MIGITGPPGAGKSTLVDAMACDQLPFTRSHVVDPGYSSRYPVVDAVALFHAEPRIVDPDFYDLASYDRLRSEYTRAARRFQRWLQACDSSVLVRALGNRHYQLAVREE